MHPWTLFKRGLMTFWYWYVRRLNTLFPMIGIEGRTLVIHPGVYKPIENEQASAAYCRDGDRVLDLGCGCGVNAIFSAGRAAEVVAVDISAAAVRNTAENVRRLGLENVTVAESDMFANVGGRFDLILANPPYIATDFEDEEAQFATSVRYLPVLFAEAAGHLNPGGRLLVQFPAWFRPKIEALAARHGLAVTEFRRMPPKSWKLKLISLAYLQVGFRSAFYLIEPVAAAPAVGNEPPAEKAA